MIWDIFVDLLACKAVSRTVVSVVYCVSLLLSLFSVPCLTFSSVSIANILSH